MTTRTRGGAEPLLHFSEDPHITRFVPHVPATNPSHHAAIWAIDAAHAPLYWFPRDCPRVTVWANDDEQRAALARLLHTTAPRVQATELGWLGRLRAVELFEYSLPPTTFRPWSDIPDGQWISEQAVEPIAVRPVGDLLARHAGAGIELRLVPDLWPLRDAVVASGLPFSLVRMHNAAPRVLDSPGTAH